MLYRKVGLACDSAVRKRSFSFSSGLVSRAFAIEVEQVEKNRVPASLESQAIWMRLNAGRALGSETYVGRRVSTVRPELQLMTVR